MKILFFSLVLILCSSLRASDLDVQPYQEASVVSATADTTTTSTSDVLLNTMTSTPRYGTYLVLFETSVAFTAEAQNGFVSLYVGGVLDTASVRSASQGDETGLGNVHSADQYSVRINKVVVLTGSQAVEVRWRTSSGTITAHQRSLTFIRLGE